MTVVTRFPTPCTPINEQARHVRAGELVPTHERPNALELHYFLMKVKSVQPAINTLGERELYERFVEAQYGQLPSGKRCAATAHLARYVS
jgi:hypothetical protein